VKALFAALATILIFVAYVPYIRDTLKGKTKPHIYSWSLWGILSVLVAAIQFNKGAGIGALVTLTTGLISFFIFFLGLKNGKRDITKLDTAIFVTAIAATFIWLFAKQPLTSMILLVGAGTLGSFPTFRKSWQKPHEETLFYWSLSPVRHLLNIGAIASYNAVTLLNPVTWVIINTAMALLLIIRRKTL
jgi:hypothetical protein